MRTLRVLKLIPAMCLILVMSLSGVYATWRYAVLKIPTTQENLSWSMTLFEYAPEEILPGGGTEVAPMGENHYTLIEKILNEASYGLNATKKPIVHELLKKPGDVVYCNQTVQGGNLKHMLLDAAEGAEFLYFVITEISDTEYHTFTFVEDALGGPYGSEIEVYKTIMVCGDNGIWTAPNSYKGYAKINEPLVVSRGIDVTSWRQG